MSLRNKAIAIVAGVAVFAAVSASAATLGGLTTNDVGANSNTVKAQVTNGVTVSWATAYNSTIQGYALTSVTLTPVSGTIPATAATRLTLTNAAGTVLGELTGTGTTLSAAGLTIPAHDIYRASLVINGGTVTAAVTGTN